MSRSPRLPPGSEVARLFKDQHFYDWLGNDARTEGFGLLFPVEQLRSAVERGEEDAAVQLLYAYHDFIVERDGSGDEVRAHYSGANRTDPPPESALTAAIENYYTHRSGENPDKEAP